MRVKKISSKGSIAGTYLQLDTDSFACGTLVVHDAGASTTLFVAVSESAPADDTGSLDLALGGAVYLHNVTPNRVWVKRSSGTNAVTARYIVYV